MRIYLIGMPGCGKSTISKELSAKIGLPAIDMDHEIIRKEGRSIEQIFEEEGESYFREIEREVLIALSEKDNLIISTGGGAPCFFDNIEIMNQRGITVFLDVPAEVISERLTTEKEQNRPMVKNKSKEEILSFLQDKMKERSKFYQKAKIKVAGHLTSADEIISQIDGINSI